MKKTACDYRSPVVMVNFTELLLNLTKLVLQTALPSILLAPFFGGWASCLSGGFENQNAAVVQMDFECVPCLALVEACRVGINWIPRAIKPVVVGLVVGNPFFDRLSRRFDDLQGIGINGQPWWACKLNDAFPQFTET